jgi:hypothetical protein
LPGIVCTGRVTSGFPFWSLCPSVSGIQSHFFEIPIIKVGSCADKHVRSGRRLCLGKEHGYRHAKESGQHKYSVPVKAYSKPGEFIALRHAMKNYLGRDSGLAAAIRAVVDGKSFSGRIRQPLSWDHRVFVPF